MRLIDADALIVFVEKWLSKECDEDGNTIPNIWIGSLKKCIDVQPTAYDVDKVVEQLEALREQERNRPDSCDEDGCGDGEQIYDDGRSQGRFEAFGKTIEIVKGG